MRLKLINNVSISFMAIGVFYLLLGLMLGLDMAIIAHYVFALFSLDFEYLCCGALAIVPRIFYYGLLFFMLFMCYLSGYANTKQVRSNANVFGIIAVIFWHLSAGMFFLISGLAH